MSSVLTKFGILRQLLFKASIDDIRQKWLAFRRKFSEFENRLPQAESDPQSGWARDSQTIRSIIASIKNLGQEGASLMAALNKNPNDTQVLTNFLHKVAEIHAEMARIRILGGLFGPEPSSPAVKEVNNLVVSVDLLLRELMDTVKDYLDQVSAQSQQSTSQKRQRLIPIPFSTKEGAEETLNTILRTLRQFIDYLNTKFPTHSALPDAQGAFQVAASIARQIRSYERGESELSPSILSELDDLIYTLNSLGKLFNRQLYYYPPDPKNTWGTVLSALVVFARNLRGGVEKVLRQGS